MKKVILATVVLLAITEQSLARRGEHDGDPNRDDGNTIVCRDGSGANVLQFHTTQLQAQVSTGSFDLAVKARGSDLGEVSITDKRSNDSIKSKRLEETLKTTLTSSSENSVPVVVETSTHRGFAEAVVRNVNSADQGSVQSLTRKGVSRMELKLVTSENPSEPISIICEKVR